MANTGISIEELKSDFEQFRRSVGKLQDLEDDLILISYELSGQNLRSPAIKSKDESKYINSRKPYRNDITELLDREEQLIRQRDYYLFRVNRVAKFLQVLTDEEVELLEYRYWYGYSIRTIADMVYMSPATLSRKFDSIFEKMKHVSSKTVI